MGVWSDLLGEKLTTSSGTTADADEALSNKKVVGIYFSAHWCPPCRGFTPKLAEWYKADLQKKGMEIVFVSSDRDEKAFKDYFAEMPWLALPYDARDIKEKLSKKFKVQGIPSFVILDAVTANVITLKGREAVSNDPTGADLPWAPKPLKELLGKTFVDSSQGDKEVDISSFEGKKLGIYFSAHWCPPCRNFTPKLAEVYKKLQAKGEKFEIVFASSDRDEAGFKEYFATMPWKAIPFADRKRKQELSSHFEVNGIPCFVMLDENREVISANAVGKVHGDAEGAKFPWSPDLINEIDEDPEGIDEVPSLVLLQEALSEEVKKQNLEALKPLAEKYRKLAKESGEEQEFNFFAASSEGRLAKRVRDDCKQGDDKSKPVVIMMDIQNGLAYYEYPKDKDVSTANVEAWIKDFKDGKLEKKSMQ